MAIVPQIDDNLHKALGLAALGYHVFPCREDNTPRISEWQVKATTNSGQIEKWWGSWPDSKVGVAAGLSGIVVMDIDVKHGKDGWASLKASGRETPEGGYSYETPSGGTHIIYGAISDTPAPCTNYQGLEGVDRRSGASYVIWHGDVPSQTPESLTDCPEWFSKPNSVGVSEANYAGTVEQWFATIPKGNPDSTVWGFLETLPDDLPRAKMLSAQVHLVKLATEGHAGIDAALDTVESIWLGRPHASGDPKDEWDRALSTAIAKYGETPSVVADATDGNPIRVLSGNPIRVLSLPDLGARPKPSWWIDGVVRKGSVCVVAGKGGVGKTFLILDWTLSIASGTGSWFGHDVKPGKVLYVAAEGVSSFFDRVQTWSTMNRTPAPEDTFHVIEEGVNLSDDRSTSYLQERIKEYETDILVLDTFSQLSAVKDENSASDVAAVMRVATALKNTRPNLTVIIVHHTTKDGKSARGSSAIRDNVDTVVMVSQDTNGIITLSTDATVGGKQRDGNPVRETGFSVSSVAGAPSAAFTRTTAPTTEDDTDPHRYLFGQVKRAIDAAGGEVSPKKLAIALGWSQQHLVEKLQPLLDDGRVISNEKPTSARRYLIG